MSKEISEVLAYKVSMGDKQGGWNGAGAGIEGGADLESLPEYCKAGVLVLGCGNRLAGDDGFGPALAEHLLALKSARHPPGKRGAEGEANNLLPSSICVLNAGTGARGVLFNLCVAPVRPKGIIIVDALDAQREPGELFWVPIEALSVEKAEDFSLHMTPASNMLCRLEKMGVEIAILACQPSPLPDRMREGLSEAATAALERAARMVVEKAFDIMVRRCLIDSSRPR